MLVRDGQTDFNLFLIDLNLKQQKEVGVVILLRIVNFTVIKKKVQVNGNKID